jgi:hypothetical protein
MPACVALVGMIVSATMVVLSMRSNREAKRTGRLRFIFWHIPGWGERDSSPSFFRVGLEFNHYRTVFFALLTVVFGAHVLEEAGLIW